MTGTRCHVRKLHSTCNDDSDCFTFLDDTTCTEGRCTCSSGFHPSASSECVPFSLGDSGCSPGDCHVIDHGDCINNVCNCTFGYSVIGDSCACDNFRDGHCIIVVLGVTKFTPYQSHICATNVDHSFWSNITHTCQCDIGHDVSTNLLSCISRGFNSSCAEDEDCSLLHNATCSAVTHRCACINSLTLNNASCIGMWHTLLMPTTQTNLNIILATNRMCKFTNMDILLGPTMLVFPSKLP